MNVKKDLSFDILHLLRKHSSKDKRLTKADIVKLLRSDFGIECDRRTVGSSLDSLVCRGYRISYDTKLKGERYHRTNWYIEPMLSSDEASLLLLSLECCPTVTPSAQSTIEKALEYSASLPENVPKISCAPKNPSLVRELYGNIKGIYEAIKQEFMVSFSIIEYVEDSRVHFEEDLGRVKEFLVKPIGVLKCESGFYLFGELGDTGIYRYFPLSRIYALKITDVTFSTALCPCVPMPLNKLESISMRFSSREKAVFSVKRSLVGLCHELLFPLCTVKCLYGDKAEIEVLEDLNVLKGFLLSLGAECEALSPTKLRRAMGAELKAASSGYSEFRAYKGKL